MQQALPDPPLAALPDPPLDPDLGDAQSQVAMDTDGDAQPQAGGSAQLIPVHAVAAWRSLELEARSRKTKR